MTLRAVILGLLGAALIATGGYLAVAVAGLEGPVAGNLAPVGVFGPLILFVLLVNPLLGLLHRNWALRPGELATAILLMLVACSIAWLGLMAQFMQVLALPSYWNALSPGWQRQNLLSYAPATMVVKSDQADPTVLGGLLAGLGAPGSPIGLDQVPWSAWVGPLTTWMPLVVLMAVASVCLGLIVHRQWSDHERLRYPIAEFAGSLIARREDQALSSVFKSKAFWIGLGVVLILRAINALDLWLHTGITVPTTLNFTPIATRFPQFTKAPFGGNLLRPKISFAVIGLSYFLASDISLSVGLTQLLSVPILLVLMSRGQDVSTDIMSGGLGGWQRAGSYAAYAGILLYTGRRYYAEVLGSALGLRRRRDTTSCATWACRGLLVCVVAVMAILVAVGLDWTLAGLTVGMILMLYVCVARITAETGLIYIQPRWQPLGVLLGLLGAYALGPSAIIIVGLLCAVLSMDVGQALMPYFVNGLRIADRAGVPPARTVWPVLTTYVLCLAAAVVVVMWANYNYGMTRADFTFNRIPKMPFQPAQRAVTELKLAGQLQQSVALSPLQRLTEMRPKKRFLWAAGAGVAMVMGLGIMRLRFSWWPIHPVMVLLWDTSAAAQTSPSYLLGWLVKTALTTLGGYRAYQKAKPLMVGFIAADFLAVLLSMLIAAGYRFATQALLSVPKVLPT
jgi:hypothetical protein